MKKIHFATIIAIFVAAILVVFLFAITAKAHAATVLFPGDGGTGWGFPGGIQSNTVLIGNGTNRLATTTQGTNGYVLSLVNGVPTWQATTTLSNISGLLNIGTQVTGNLSVNSLNGGTGASGTTFWRGDGTWATPAGAGTVTSITLGGGLDGLSPITNSGTITAQIGTSTVPNIGGLAYWTGNATPSLLGTVATTSATINNGLTGTLTTIGASQTIGLAQIANGNALAFVGSGSGVPVATATSTWFGTGTGGQHLVWNNGVPQWVATTTFSAPLVFSGGNVTITTASAGVTGALSGTDWSTFNNKLSSYDAFTHPSAGQSATTSLMLLFGNASTTQFTSTSTTYLASVNGNVGIGATSTPGTLLSIAGIANFTTASTTFYGTGGINLAGGCFAISGTCLTAGSIGGGATEAVNWATVAVLAGTPTYANGASGVGATLTEVGTGALSVDGNSPAAGDRVLVKNQASAFQNGIYAVTATGSGIASYVLTRVTDYNSPTEITPGITTYVLSGTTNTDTTWAVSYTPPLVIGTNNLTYTEAAGTNGTVTSVATNNGLTGGTITTTGTIGLATINAGVLGAATNGSVPTSQATSTLYGLGTNGFVLAEVAGIPTWTATTTFNSPLTYASGAVSCATCVTTSRQLTIAGTAAQITSSAGAQDLSADRTWTLSLPNHVKFPTDFEASAGTTTNATTTGSQYFTGITASRPLYVDSTGKLTSAGSGTSGNCVNWGANNTFGDAGAACGTGGTGIGDPFTHVSVWSQTTSATSTLIALTGAPYSLVASSTVAISNLQVGSTSPNTNANAPLVVSGNFNGIVQSVFRNSNSGNNASSNLIIENDKSTDTTYYSELGQNSSGYSQAAFSAQNPGDTYLDSSDGALVLGTASSTNSLADIRFTVGGTASSSIVGIFRGTGQHNFGVGTTSPFAQLSIGVGGDYLSHALSTAFAIGSSTAGNATTTLFSVDSAGTITTKLGASALVLSTNGTLGNYAGAAACTNQVVTAISSAGASTCTTVANAMLANSTISGVALGGTLFGLSATNGTLTFSSTYTGTAAQTVGLNLASANNWTSATTGFSSSTPWAELAIGTTTSLSPSLNLFGVSSSTNAAIFNISASGLFGFASATPSAVLGEQSTYVASSTALFYSSIIGSSTPAFYIGSPNQNGFVGIGTTSPWAGLSINAPAGTAPFAIGSSTNPITWIDSLGKFWDRDILNNWSGIMNPTKYISLGVGTTTTLLGTSTAPYIPQTVLMYAGTIETAQCTASTTNAFIGIQPYIGTTALTFFVASNTVGTMHFTASNTFTAGQVLSFSYGTSTSFAGNQSVGCTFSAIQTQ